MIFIICAQINFDPLENAIFFSHVSSLLDPLWKNQLPVPLKKNGSRGEGASIKLINNNKVDNKRACRSQLDKVRALDTLIKRRWARRAVYTRAAAISQPQGESEPRRYTLELYDRQLLARRLEINSRRTQESAERDFIVASPLN
jgi:hypothetical protein